MSRITRGCFEESEEKFDVVETVTGGLKQVKLFCFDVLVALDNEGTRSKSAASEELRDERCLKDALANENGDAGVDAAKGGQSQTSTDKIIQKVPVVRFPPRAKVDEPRFLPDASVAPQAGTNIVAKERSWSEGGIDEAVFDKMCRVAYHPASLGFDKGLSSEESHAFVLFLVPPRPGDLAGRRGG
jgi:hypothetical protein